MQLFRSAGWMLLVGAFLAAAAESAAQAISREFGILSSIEVMSILAPEFLAAAENVVSGILGPFIWNILAASLLALPGWLLLGVPGGYLAWRYRTLPHGGDEDLTVQTSFEDIVAAAQEADQEDNGLPSKYRDVGEYDPSYPPEDEFDALNPIDDPEPPLISDIKMLDIDPADLDGELRDQVQPEQPRADHPAPPRPDPEDPANR